MFDVIVSDIAMPDMDGLDFARAVRAGGPWARLPMIALSARAEPRRHRGRPRRRLHRLRREVPARGADRQPAAMPGRADRGVMTTRHAVTLTGNDRDMQETMHDHRCTRTARRSDRRRGTRLRHPDRRRSALRRAGAGVRDILGEQPITRIPLAPPEIAGSLNLRGRIVTAIDLRRRLHLPPPPAGPAAHVGGRRTGRRTLRAAGRSGVRGDEPQGQRVRAQSADAAAGLGAVQQRHLPAGRPAAGGAGRRASCSRSAKPPEARAWCRDLPGRR